MFHIPNQEIVAFLSKSEFLLEQGLAYILPPNSKSLIEILTFFELGKFFFRFRKFSRTRNLNNLYITEEKPLINDGKSESTLLFDKLADEPLEKMKEQINKEDVKKILENIKNRSFEEENYNSGYGEKLGKNGKKIGILKSLPIPNEMISKNTETKFKRARIIFGELLNLIRPFVYCLSLVYFKTDSFKPYFISMAIDLLRIVVQLGIVCFSEEEKKELHFRKRELLLCYLLRTPFYGRILKGRVIEPLLDKLCFKFQILKTIILYFIEVRCSLSMLM